MTRSVRTVNAYTVAQIAAEFGVSRPTIYRHVANISAESPAPQWGSQPMVAE